MNPDDATPQEEPQVSADTDSGASSKTDKKDDYNWITKTTGGLLLFEAAVFITFAIVVKCSDLISTVSIKSLCYYSVAGFLGGNVYCMRIFYQTVTNKCFDNRYFWWYLFRPVLGMISAVFAVFMIIGGLFSINPSSPSSNTLALNISIAFIVGIVFSRFMDMVNRISEIVLVAKQKDDTDKEVKR